MENHKRRLLVVDDIQINRILLRELFSEKFDVLEAGDGAEALTFIEKYDSEIAAILLDLVMPKMNGFQLLEAINRSGAIKRIPVIVITGESDEHNALASYGLGVSDLMSKPFNPDIITRRVDNIVDLYSHKNFLEQKLSEQKKILIKQDQRLKQINMFLVDALSTAVEFRSNESGEHVRRIRYLTKLLLELVDSWYPCSPNELEMISSASGLHDIGKIAIPDSILLKPGPLTDEEFEVMKTHTIQGCEILKNLNYIPDTEYYHYLYKICRHHHERWDGKGYPDGLVGDEIPIWVQAVSLADVYDALTSDRVYKKAYSHEEAIGMVLRGECGQFNPVLMAELSKVADRLPAEITRRLESDEY